MASVVKSGIVAIGKSQPILTRNVPEPADSRAGGRRYGQTNDGEVASLNSRGQSELVNDRVTVSECVAVLY